MVDSGRARYRGPELCRVLSRRCGVATRTPARASGRRFHLRGPGLDLRSALPSDQGVRSSEKAALLCANWRAVAVVRGPRSANDHGEPPDRRGLGRDRSPGRGRTRAVAALWRDRDRPRSLVGVAGWFRWLIRLFGDHDLAGEVEVDLDLGGIAPVGARVADQLELGGGGHLPAIVHREGHFFAFDVDLCLVEL